MSSPSTLFDLTGWAWVRLTGRDAHKFLHNFCTNDVLKLPQTYGCEAFVTNVKARVLGHIFAFEAADAETGPAVDVFSFPGQDAPLLAHLDRYLIREEVAFENRTDATFTSLLSGAVPQDDEALRPFETRHAVVGKCRVTMRRLDLLGEPGHLIVGDRENVAHVREAFLESGATSGDAATFESRRIEAVLPIYGIDLSEDQLAPEAGRPWAISYTKGCYLGQEPIARIDALGHVNKLLRGVRLEADVVPERGASVVADGKEIGTVTSAIAGTALAYIRSKYSEPGTIVAIGSSNEEIPAQIFASSEPRP
ncbi:MAG: hypothetical protein H0T47_10860 [Planctomycetaceae bacterium]|nr:hypothetical protein [Planctomycetaceae bacterium]